MTHNGGSVDRRLNKAVRLAFAGLTMVATLATIVAVPAKGADAVASWPKVRFDNANTGFNPSETSLTRANVATLAQDWTGPATRTFSHDLVRGGVVFGGCEQMSFCAIDATSGAIRWKTVLGEPLWLISPPRWAALVGNVVYFGVSRPGYEYALDATTGAVLWRTLVSNSGADWQSPPVVSDGMVFQASEDFLFAWDAATGIQRWVMRLNVHDVPAVVDGVVYVLADRTGARLHALRATTGQVLWASPLIATDADGSPIVAGGLVVVATANPGGTAGLVAAYPAAGCGSTSCSPLWRYDSASPPNGDGTVAGSVIYQGFLDGSFRAIDLQSGRLLWQVTTPHGPSQPARPGSTTVAGGLLYGTADGWTYAWPAEGCGPSACQPLWQAITGGDRAAGEIEVVDGRLYVSHPGAGLYAYTPRLNPRPVTTPPPVQPLPPPPAGPFPPTTIQVPRDQLSIQRAIDASHPGDVVVVSPGVYHERLDFHGHAVEVRSSAGPGTTIIDGDALSAVVMFQSGETRASILRGFTIQHAEYSGLGGAIGIVRASATIAGNVIADNGTMAISGYVASVAIVDNQLRRNRDFLSNGGGGVDLGLVSSAEIVGNVIEDNDTDGSGGGISVSGGTIVISDNVVRRNVAGRSGGGIVAGATNLLVSQNVIADNTAGESGGGLSTGVAAGSRTVVLANTIASNAAAAGSGVFVGYSVSPAEIVDNLVTGAPGTSLVDCDHTYYDVIPAFSHNDVYTGAPFPIVGCGSDPGGPGRLSVDPRYADPGSADYRLASGSPAIDAGDGSVPSLPPLDIAGSPRVVDGNADGASVIDIGAYEAQPPVPDIAAGRRFHPLMPARILDTRTGAGSLTKIGPQSPKDLQVTGQGGVPTTGVSAVVLNVTVTDPTATGFLMAWPTGGARPLASNLNFDAHQTVANLVIVKVGQGGKVSLYNNAGSTNVIADVAGWFGEDGPSAPGAGYASVAPARVLDTRLGQGSVAAKMAPISTLDVQVTGQGGVPGTGVSAVVLNVTVTDPTSAGFLTAWPTGTTRPQASNLNFDARQTVPNLVIVKVGQGGKVSLYNNAGSVDVLADVAGWFGDNAATGSTAGYTSLSPARILDTRTGLGAATAKLGAASTLELQVTGKGGIPATGVAAVVLNVTVTDPTITSFLTAWPSGTTRPVASSLNFDPRKTVPNLVTVKVGAGGRVSLYNNAGATNVVIDVAGWYSI